MVNPPATIAPVQFEFWSDLERFGEAPALVLESGREVGYAELAALADAFAASLPETARLVALEGRNALEAVVAYLGVLRSRRVAMMLPEGAASAEALCAAFPPDARYRSDNGCWTLTCEDQSTECHRELAVLLSTSGTTGAAKLVRLSRGNVAANARSIAEYLDLDDTETAITSLAISYSYGLSVINSHLAVGARIALTERSVTDSQFWHFAARTGATSLAGVPHTYDLLLAKRYFADPPATLRTLTQAGGRMAPETVRRFDAEMKARGGRLFVMYGQTEATARMAYVPPNMLSAHADCIGIAIPGGQFTLRDPEGNAVEEAGVPGELCYRGPNVMMGYAYRPEDLRGGSELEELRTGDLAERTADGLYKIVGRLSRFVKPFGLRIALDEIERQLEDQGLQAMVAGNDERIVIAVLGSAADVMQPSKLADDLAGKYDLPPALFHVRSVEAFPHLANGKRDYAKILHDDRAPVPDAQFASVAALYQEHFRVPVRDEDSFISLGGDSMSFVTVSLALEERLGTLPDGWEALPICRLEALADGHEINLSPRAAGGRIDTSVLVRAVAITLVVINHASLLPIGGGAFPLILLIGVGWAWLQQSAFAAGNVAPVLRTLWQRVLPPYFAVVIATACWRGEPSLSSFLLVSNYDAALRGMLEPMWFISAMVQATLLIAVLVTASDRLRSLIAIAPFRLGLWAFAATTAIQIVCEAFSLAVPGRSLDQVLPIIALGWLAALSRGESKRQACTLVCLAVLLGTEVVSTRLELAEQWPRWLNYITLSLAVAMLLFTRRVAMGPIARPVRAVAVASFTIYITHSMVLWVIGKASGYPQPGILAAFVAIMAGVAIHLTAGSLAQHFRTRQTFVAGEAKS